MRAKFRELGRDSLIYGLSGMLQKFIAVLLVPLYWNVFVTGEMGKVSIVTSFVTLLSGLTVLGLDNAAATWYWHTEDEQDRAATIASWFWCQMTVSAVAGGVLALLAPSVSTLLTGSPDVAPLLRFAAATLPLSVAGTVLTNVLRLRRRARATLWFSLGSSLLLVVLNLLLISVFRWGMSGFFLSQIVAWSVTTIAGAWLLRGAIRPGAVRLPRLREMLRFALPMVPASLALWVMTLSDRFFLQYFSGFGEVGLYDAGTRLATAVAMVTGAFGMAWAPFALSHQRQEDAPRFYARALLVYLAAGGAMVTGVALFTPEVLSILAKPDYLAAAPIVGILCFGVLANGMATIAGTGLALAKKSAPVSIAVFLAAVVSVILNVLLIPVLGKTGAALASAVSWTVYVGYLFVRAQRVHPIPYDLRRAAIIGFLLAAIVLAAPLLQTSSLLLTVLVKAAAALVAVCLLFSIALPGWPGMLRRLLPSA